jgi:hypothetical protein
MYVQVILGHFFPESTEEETLYCWFQQDSATTDTARMSMQSLSDVFGDRIIKVIFGQHIQPILILVIFSSGVV